MRQSLGECEGVSAVKYALKRLRSLMPTPDYKKYSEEMLWQMSTTSADMLQICSLRRLMRDRVIYTVSLHLVSLDTLSYLMRVALILGRATTGIQAFC